MRDLSPSEDMEWENVLLSRWFKGQARRVSHHLKWCRLLLEMTISNAVQPEVRAVNSCALRFYSDVADSTPKIFVPS